VGGDWRTEWGGICQVIGRREKYIRLSEVVICHKVAALKTLDAGTVVVCTVVRTSSFFTAYLYTGILCTCSCDNDRITRLTPSAANAVVSCMCNYRMQHAAIIAVCPTCYCARIACNNCT